MGKRIDWQPYEDEILREMGPSIGITRQLKDVCALLGRKKHAVSDRLEVLGIARPRRFSWTKPAELIVKNLAFDLSAIEIACYIGCDVYSVEEKMRNIHGYVPIYRGKFEVKITSSKKGNAA